MIGHSATRGEEPLTRFPLKVDQGTVRRSRSPEQGFRKTLAKTWNPKITTIRDSPSAALNAAGRARLPSLENGDELSFRQNWMSKAATASYGFPCSNLRLLAWDRKKAG